MQRKQTMPGGTPAWRSAAGLLLAIALSGCQQTPRDLFQEGLNAYSQGDYALAFSIWRPLAEAGDARAQTNIGLMYSQGKGVAANAAEAFKWYHLAAMQHNIDAQYNLALLYRDGKGVEVNLQEALRWFQLAAEKGHLLAQVRLGEMYFKGMGVKADTREAIKWYEMAANKGEPSAQVALGEIFARGQGVPTDRVRAYFWYSAAFTQDYDPLLRARAAIGRMRLMSSMDEVELIEGERQAEEWREIRRTEANRE